MKTINVSLKVPDWGWNFYKKIKYQWKKWAFMANRPKCECCGVGMNVKNPQYTYTFPNGNRLIVENHGSVICRQCFARELTWGEWKPRHDDYGHWRTYHCDVLGHYAHSYKDVVVEPHVDALFCTLAWNWSRVSKEAVVTCVNRGTIGTSCCTFHNDKLVSTNHVGLMIDKQGDLI